MGKLKEVLILKHFFIDQYPDQYDKFIRLLSIDRASLKEYTALFLNLD